MPETIDRKNPHSSKTLLVVGNGMVAHRLCDRLVERDADRRWRIVVVGEESRLAYDRVHLSEVFSGRKVDDLTLAGAQWYGTCGIRVRTGESVTSIDCDSRVATTSLG